MVSMEEDQYTTFNPSLWRQRRAFILDVLRAHNVTSVLDYGCGEGSILSFLIPPTLGITRLGGLDICISALEQAAERCQPWPADYNILRDSPLTIDIYHGSVDQYDERLVSFEAIICSEVIEHLYGPTLDRILHTTLGRYNPKLLVITTPNAEYNANFEGLNYGKPSAVFRHDDHKFEWTRREFQTWCEKGARQYNYDVSFHGIGLMEGKRDDTSLGHCTQACTFVRRDPSAIEQHTSGSKDNDSTSTPHQHIQHIEFPYCNEPPLSDNEALQVVEEYISCLCQVDVNDDGCDQPPTETQQHPPALDWCLDWSYVSPPPSQDVPEEHNDRCQQQQLTPSGEGHTRVPQRFPISILWDIPRVRQVCKAIPQLIQLLTKHTSGYQIEGDDLVVLKSFALLRDDGDVYTSTVSSDQDNDTDL